MSGVLNVILANRGNVRVSVGVGNTSTFYGFIVSNIGTATPSTYGGANIRNIVTDSNDYDLQIVLEGTLAQNFFAGVVVQTTSGAFRTFLTSAATFQQIAGTPNQTVWKWDSNTPVLTSTTPSPRSVQFF